eukprot:13274766-Ditylum_brightwellii.AAC.1
MLPMARPSPEPPPVHTSKLPPTMPHQIHETQRKNEKESKDATATSQGQPHPKLRSKPGWKKGFLLTKPMTTQTINTNCSKQCSTPQTYPPSSQNTKHEFIKNPKVQQTRKMQQKGWKQGFLLTPQTCNTS